MKPQKPLHLYKEQDKKKPKYIGRQYAMTEKYDGWYGYADMSTDTTYPHIIRSRAGRHIPAVDDLAKELHKNVHANGRLIFEILVRGVPAFHTLNGILNRKYEQADAYLRVHDFVAEYMDVTALDRYDRADDIVRSANMEGLLIAPIIGISDDPEVWRWNVEKLWAEGKEGLILKDTMSYYSPGGRNWSLMKIKEEVTFEAVVVKVVQGDGKYANTTGSIIVQTKDGKQHPISGMTDKQRHQWWEDPNSILGEVTENKAMKKLPDGTYREPRFKAIRYDKLPNDID